MFAEQGYEGSSLREIAERLGVTKAALYYHFKTKEDIVRALLEDSSASLDELIEWARTQPPTIETRQEILRRYAALLGGSWRQLLSFIQDNQPAFRELGVKDDIAQRLRAIMGLVRDPNADVTGQLRSVLAVVALHLGHAPGPPGLDLINATPEEAAAASLSIAMELVAEPA